MERILLSHDKPGYEKALKAINADLARYNNLISVIVENTDKVSVSKENIKKLLDDPKDFLFDLVVKKDQLNFNGLPINKKKAIELIDFPGEFNKIITAFTAAKQAFKNTKNIISSDTEIDMLSLDDVIIDDGYFKCSESFLSGLKEEFSSYTRTEKQIEAVNLMHQFDQALDGLIRIGLIKNSRNLEDLRLIDMGFKFYDSKKSIDLDQIRSVR